MVNSNFPTVKNTHDAGLTRARRRDNLAALIISSAKWTTKVEVPRFFQETPGFRSAKPRRYDTHPGARSGARSSENHAAGHAHGRCGTAGGWGNAGAGAFPAVDVPERAGAFTHRAGRAARRELADDVEFHQHGGAARMGAANCPGSRRERPSGGGGRDHLGRTGRPRTRLPQRGGSPGRRSRPARRGVPPATGGGTRGAQKGIRGAARFGGQAPAELTLRARGALLNGLPVEHCGSISRISVLKGCRA